MKKSELQVGMEIAAMYSCGPYPAADLGRYSDLKQVDFADLERRVLARHERRPGIDKWSEVARRKRNAAVDR